MKLGLVTDIHEHVEYLRMALNHFRAERVDQVVVIGDVFEMGKRIGETCQLLSHTNVTGVWGNHDYGLCFEPDAETRCQYGDDVIGFMTKLRPRMEIDGCHFAHVEPWLNPEDLADLWYFDGLPDAPDKLARIFNAVPNRLIFAGHFHKWLLVTPARIEDWQGDRPVRLNADRYFVVIGALCDGCYAVLNTETAELIPFRIGEAKRS